MNCKSIIWLLLVALIPFGMSSCQSDEDEITYTDYCYMSSLQLGSMRRIMHTTTEDGADSIYTTTFSGTLFPMTIDQRNHTVKEPNSPLKGIVADTDERLYSFVENKDSLPYGTNVDAVLVTVGFEGVCAWRKVDLSADADTTWTPYDKNDSLDLTKPLEFVVVANNGNSYRRYIVKVNVHQEVGNTMRWADEGQQDILDSMETRRAFFVGGKVVVIGQTKDGVACATRGTDAWESTLTAIDTADISGIQQRGDKLYMLDKNQTLLVSADGIDWTACGQATSGMRLVAASAECLYGMTTDGLWTSHDGTTWLQDQLDDEPSRLPQSNIVSTTYTQTNGHTRILLMGLNDKDINVWAKSWGAKSSEANAVWTYYTPNGADTWHCPVMDNLNILCYDKGLIAFGGKTTDGRFEAMDSVFYSVDNGVTWKAHDDMDVNEALRAQAKDAKHITATIDDDNYLWVFVDNNVWRGRLARMGFDRQDR